MDFFDEFDDESGDLEFDNEAETKEDVQRTPMGVRQQEMSQTAHEYAQQKQNTGDYGESSTAEIPVFKFNFGAFLLGFIFALVTGAYKCLITLIPFLNIVFMFISGFKGEQWAWESGKYSTEDDFREVMNKWNKIGKISFIILCVLVGLYLLFVFGLMALVYKNNFMY